jgi:hypothetical protein
LEGRPEVSAWKVIPCLLTLRDEFDHIAPNRDRGSDGTIGDSAHTSRSDHTPDEDSDVLRSRDSDRVNEVHALDVDTSGPWPVPFPVLFAEIIEREQRRWLDPNDRCRLEYAIFNRLIYERENDFAPVTYTGTSDPHTGHAHFSARYLTETENDISPWGVQEAVDVTKDEVKAAVIEVLRSSEARDIIGDAVLERSFPAPAGVEDSDGKWWYGSFDQQAYVRLLELKKSVDTLLERLPGELIPPPGQ